MTISADLFAIAAILLTILAALSAYFKHKPKYEYRLKPLMTDNEVEFYFRLRRALPKHEIFAQVAMGAILRPRKEYSGKEVHLARNAYSQKIIDFVICEPKTCRPVVVVELDDRTHNPQKDAIRDRMLTSAGLCVVRYRSNDRPTEDEIRTAILALFAKHGRSNSPLQSTLGDLRSSALRRKLARS